jgi:adenine-specific DNA-methyltransferase
MEERIESSLTSLEHLSQEELVQRLKELEEQLRMSQTLLNSPDLDSVDTEDATLYWHGSRRFLTETITPVRLEPIKSESLNIEKGPHLIIDGDNLSVMRSLLTDFRGGPNKGFDVIYMDPPYNTGQDIFSYSDDYRSSKTEIKALRRKNGRLEGMVSLEDTTRHTKWINHIAPRLWAAKKLMKHTGIIIISVDEHELPRLWMLMEKLFGEKNRIATLIWEKAIKNDAKYISEGHEYMLVWARDKAALDVKVNEKAATSEWQNERGRWRKKKDGVDEILTAYAEAKNEYGEDIAKIQQAMNLFFSKLPPDHAAKRIRYRKVNAYGMYNDDGNLNWPGGGGPTYDVLHPKTGKICKKPELGWRYSEDTMKELIEQGRIAFKENHTKVPRLITYLHEMDNEVQTSVIRKVGQRAVQTVNSILGKGKYSNPKDHELLVELFNLVTWHNKDSTILDPYAGSGTTAHAVLSMNLVDGGNRRFVLIENGDPNYKGKSSRDRYTAEVTAERVRRVITGEWADGKVHPIYDTGFHFYRAREKITRQTIMSSTRETLADIILQVVEDDSNKLDYRFQGYTYLIGRTRSGYGIALVWEASRGKQDGRTLTWDIRNKILDEAEEANVAKPIYIYAAVNTAPLNNDLYRFCQIPNWILVRLGILDSDEDNEE